MSDTLNVESVEMKEKPVLANDDVIFPPFPEPTENDFDEDISTEEREYYKNKFKDLNTIKTMRLHCSACDRHLGCSARQESRMRVHPMLRTLVCHTCLTFYNSGEFDKGDDGSELYCRWCGQGGQVYCCAGCPHVFCAKCIKRNLGVQKIKEIEELDDWKCFNCNPKCLWDLRGICWALLRYCDQKNQITHNTEDSDLKEKYKKECIKDISECCKRKSKVKEKHEPKKKEETPVKTTTDTLISKITPTIQVRKFASINMDDVVAKEKKALKRAASPRQKAIPVKNPIAIAPKSVTPLNIANKRFKVGVPNMNPIRIAMDKKPVQMYTNTRQPRPKMPASLLFNGFGTSTSTNSFNLSNDNINLSLESLTQGLDMSAVAAMTSSMQDDDVVCTPDFPIEPLCEVTEDNADDDVQCITPAPPPSAMAPPPLAAITTRSGNLPELCPDNIIQMTDNDVTVNAATGGLKFRVDPQTLSSNKMYRLPDGRIFAINANSNMPGGYSATIVAVTDGGASGKMPSKGATYAAKLSAVLPQSTPTPGVRTRGSRNKNTKQNNTTRSSKATKSSERRSTRWCDLNIPVEWYRYNLIDAMDSLEYSLTKLAKLKKEATTVYLRSRTVNEIRGLHKTLDRLLSTSAQRFSEIRENLNKELKQFIEKKQSSVTTDDDDDDVEILPNTDNNDDPIFIDENSLESTEDHEVDLTGLGSSEHDSSGKSIDKTFTPIVSEDNCIHDVAKNIITNNTNTTEDETAINDKKITNDRSSIKDDSPSNGETTANGNSPTNEIHLSNDISSTKDTPPRNCTSPTNNSNPTNYNSSSIENNLTINSISKNDTNSTDDNVKDEMDINEEILDPLDTDTDVRDDTKEIGDGNEKETDEKSENNETLKNRNAINAEEEELSVDDTLIEEDVLKESTEDTDEKTDDNEMSEKTIEDLLRDDNESVSDTMNNHSAEQVSDVKAV